MAKLTKKYIESIKPPIKGFIQKWDDEIKGFGARIMPTGTITYIAYYRAKNGRQRKVSLGRHGVITPTEARKRALRVLADVSDDKDPAEEREQARNNPSFAYLADEYLKRHASQKKSGIEDERMLKKDLLPRWHHIPALEIGRREVLDVLNDIKDRGAPIAANRTLSLVRKMFNFGMDQAIVESNPCARIKPPAKEQQRDRVLTEKEIKRFWERLPKTDASSQLQAILKLILVTAQRPGEVIGVAWPEIELEEGWWMIPAEKSKNGLAHRVPLSQMALEIVKSMNPKEGYLFPSPKDPAKHIKVNALSHAIRRNQDIFGLPDFRPHDLRRTAASHMSSMGINRLVISKILNHVETGVTAVYDRYGYDKEKQTAVNSWNIKLKNLLEGTKGDIIPIAR